MDDSGFPRTPDRPVKLLGTCVRYLRSVETSIGARGPDFLGGSATDTRQMKVTCSLDTASTLSVTTLALVRNFRLYQESSTRAPIMRTDDEPASK